MIWCVVVNCTYLQFLMVLRRWVIDYRLLQRAAKLQFEREKEMAEFTKTLGSHEDVDRRFLLTGNCGNGIAPMQEDVCFLSPLQAAFF